MYYLIEIKQPTGPHLWTAPLIKTPLRGPSSEILCFPTFDFAFALKWALEHSPNRPPHVIYEVDSLPPFLLVLPSSEDTL